MLIDEVRNAARRTVFLEDRTFIVVMDATTMEARSIKERKVVATVRDETYWHASHGVPQVGRGAFFGGKSIVQRLLDAADARYDHLPSISDLKEAA